MANLKAVDVDKLDALIADIADAVREKTGKTDLIPDDEIPNEIRAIETGGGDDLYRQLIDGSISGELIIPEGVTKLRAYALAGASLITNIKIPDSITSIGKFAFGYCTGITRIVIPDSVTSLGDEAFSESTQLSEIVLGNGIKTIPYQMMRRTIVKELVIPHGVTTLKAYCFNQTSIKTMWLPNTLTKCEGLAFSGCGGIETLTLESGFNCADLVVSFCTKLTIESLVAMFEALADLTGQTTKKLTIGATNLAKLSEEQIAIATQKNWTIA